MRRAPAARILRWATLSHLLLAVVLSGCRPPLPLPNLTDVAQTRIQGIVDAVSSDELMSVLSDLNGIRHYTVDEPPLLAEYEAKLVGRFERLGYAVLLQPVLLPEPGVEIVMNNIIVTKPGTDPTLSPVLYTGHWDSVGGGPGINDNATACAAVLEAARLLADEQLERTIVFILYAFEEEGLVGSYHYIDTLTTDIYGVINFDMIGYTAAVQNVLPLTDIFLGFPTRGDFVAVFASHFSREWALAYAYAIETFVPDLPYYMAVLDDNLADNPLFWDVLRSDHTAAWEQGIPGVFITDTAQLREGHPYHTEDDTIANIDQQFFYRNVQAGLAALCIQAGLVGL